MMPLLRALFDRWAHAGLAALLLFAVLAAAQAQIPNVVTPLGKGGRFTAVFLGSNSGANSWASQPLGTADPTRIIASCALDAAGTSITGLTIAGNSAGAAKVSLTHAKVFALAVPTGTSATIAVTGSSSATLNGIAFYALYGLSSTTPKHTGTSTGTSSANTLVDAAGIVIGCVTRIGASVTLSGTGYNADANMSVSGSTFAASSLIYSATSTTSTLNSSLAADAMALASWGPN